MGKHGRHEKGAGRHQQGDDRPPAKTGKDLCKAHGHGGNKKVVRGPYKKGGQWKTDWHCSRCDQGWTETAQPPGGQYQ